MIDLVRNRFYLFLDASLFSFGSAVYHILKVTCTDLFFVVVVFSSVVKSI